MEHSSKTVQSIHDGAEKEWVGRWSYLSNWGKLAGDERAW